MSIIKNWNDIDTQDLKNWNTKTHIWNTEAYSWNTEITNILETEETQAEENNWKLWSPKLPERYIHKHSWKVRETYYNPDNSEQLLLIATNRVSTHDVVHKTLIPWKWESLTQISNFWFETMRNDSQTSHIKTQVVENPIWPADFPEELKESTVIVRKLKALPIEAIVRWYLYWSALSWYNSETWLLKTWEFVWKWLKKCSKFKEATFTPSTKSDEWDVNINFDKMVEDLQDWLLENDYQYIDAYNLAKKIEEYSILMYNTANKKAIEKNIILWDTKFEYWLDDNWELIVIDEQLTPDSSRYWSEEWFEEWKEPESNDKQFIRDYVISYWKTHPDVNWKYYWEKWFVKYPIEIPEDVVSKSQINYTRMKILFN